MHTEPRIIGVIAMEDVIAELIQSPTPPPPTHTHTHVYILYICICICIIHAHTLTTHKHTHTHTHTHGRGHRNTKTQIRTNKRIQYKHVAAVTAEFLDETDNTAEVTKQILAPIFIFFF